MDGPFRKRSLSGKNDFCIKGERFNGTLAEARGVELTPLCLEINSDLRRYLVAWAAQRAQVFERLRKPIGDFALLIRMDGQQRQPESTKQAQTRDYLRHRPSRIINKISILFRSDLIDLLDSASTTQSPIYQPRGCVDYCRNRGKEAHSQNA
jgi:hypothetical protein